MPRRPRQSTGGYIYHVLNRAAGDAPIFTKPSDYRTFEQVLEDSRRSVDVRVLAYCLMPDYWRLLLWPRRDGELSEFMRVATVTHVQRWHAAHGTAGSGSLYRSRFKSFPVQKDRHLLSMCRYIESTAVRAKRVKKAEDWRWSSLWRRLNAGDEFTLTKLPISLPRNWPSLVNRPLSEAELEALEQSMTRDAPFGAPSWKKTTAERLGLESTLRPRGRPRKS